MGFETTTTEFCSDALTKWAIRPWVQLILNSDLYSYSNVIFCSLFVFHFRLLPLWVTTFIDHMSVAEWTDTYVIHNGRIFRSSYRKLIWARFLPMTTDFCSNALNNWAIMPQFQLALRANFVQLMQFHLLFRVHISFQLLPSSVTTFILMKILR